MARSGDLGERVHHGARVHRGARFDVYRGRDGACEVARKVPAEQTADTSLFEASTSVGGVSTAWSLQCGTRGGGRQDEDVPEPVSNAELLASEAETLGRHGRAWGHELRSFESDAERPVLETPWHEAVPLGSLPRDRARALLPALLPTLWDALTDRLHGDLSPSNLLVSPDGPRAFLIDPAPFVLRGQVYDCAPITSVLDLHLVTTGPSYPLLPPWYASALALASGATLDDHVREFVGSLTLSHHARPVAEGVVVMHAVGALGRALAGSFSLEEDAPDARGNVSIRGRIRPSLQPPGEPHPADLLALGIALYEVLTGRHPFGLDPDTPPAWVGLDALDDRVEGTDRLMALLEWPILAPSALASDVTAGEDRLVLALLTLDLPDRDRLAALCERGG